MKLSLLALLVGMSWGQTLDLDQGSLEINTQPGLKVVWEGSEIGIVPAGGRLLIRDIPPGQYRFELKQGEVTSLAQTISISPGTQELSFQPLISEHSKPTGPDGHTGSSTRGSGSPTPTRLMAPQLQTTEEPPRQAAALKAEVAHQESDDERLSQQAITSEGFPWLPLILLALGIASFAAYSRRRRRPPPGPHGTIEYVPMNSPVPQGPAVLPEEQASFLEALEDRETAMESGVEQVPPRPKRTIDIDSRTVREDDDRGN